MRTFDFTVDSKEKIWYRENFCIEANSQNEANRIAKKLVINRCINMSDELDDLIEYCEYMPETAENMTVAENNGYAVIELLDSTGNEVYNNGQEILCNEPRMYWLDVQNNDYDDSVMHNYEAFITEAENCGNVATILKFSQMLNSGEINAENCLFNTNQIY